MFFNYFNIYNTRIQTRKLLSNITFSKPQLLAITTRSKVILINSKKVKLWFKRETQEWMQLGCLGPTKRKSDLMTSMASSPIICMMKKRLKGITRRPIITKMTAQSDSTHLATQWSGGSIHKDIYPKRKFRL